MQLPTAQAVKVYLLVSRYDSAAACWQFVETTIYCVEYKHTALGGCCFNERERGELCKEGRELLSSKVTKIDGGTHWCKDYTGPVGAATAA